MEKTSCLPSTRGGGGGGGGGGGERQRQRVLDFDASLTFADLIEFAVTDSAADDDEGDDDDDDVTASTVHNRSSFLSSTSNCNIGSIQFPSSCAKAAKQSNKSSSSSENSHLSNSSTTIENHKSRTNLNTKLDASQSNSSWNSITSVNSTQTFPRYTSTRILAPFFSSEGAFATDNTNLLQMQQTDEREVGNQKEDSIVSSMDVSSNNVMNIYDHRSFVPTTTTTTAAVTTTTLVSSQDKQVAPESLVLHQQIEQRNDECASNAKADGAPNTAIIPQQIDNVHLGRTSITLQIGNAGGCTNNNDHYNYNYNDTSNEACTTSSSNPPVSSVTAVKRKSAKNQNWNASVDSSTSSLSMSSSSKSSFVFEDGRCNTSSSARIGYYRTMDAMLREPHGRGLDRPPTVRQRQMFDLDFVASDTNTLHVEELTIPKVDTDPSGTCTSPDSVTKDIVGLQPDECDKLRVRSNRNSSKRKTKTKTPPERSIPSCRWSTDAVDERDAMDWKNEPSSSTVAKDTNNDEYSTEISDLTLLEIMSSIMEISCSKQCSKDSINQSNHTRNGMIGGGGGGGSGCGVTTMNVMNTDTNHVSIRPSNSDDLSKIDRIIPIVSLEPRTTPQLEDRNVSNLDRYHRPHRCQEEKFPVDTTAVNWFSENFIQSKEKLPSSLQTISKSKSLPSKVHYTTHEYKYKAFTSGSA